jgi:hypothetical protein
VSVFVLGKEGGTVVRQIGRLYGRMNRLKSELLGEFAKAADLPPPVAGQPVSLRQSLLNFEPGTGRTVGVPIAVTSPPPVPEEYRPIPVPAAAAAPMGMGPSTWAVSYPHPTDAPERFP